MKIPLQAIVIGGGLGGLWAALRIADAGFPLQLFSLFEVKRSHSVCAQGGINAVLDTKGERDSVRQHIIDTIKGGEYLANQPPIKSLCEHAPGLIRTFERMGVTFSRTSEGILDQRLFGGVKNRRTCFAGASTGQQLLYGVDQQVRRLESLGRIEKFEWWEFLSLLQDADGTCRGIVAMDLRSLEVRAFPAEVVVLATGGFGQLYAPKTTTSTNCTGAAASRCYQQGARFANAEFFQFHPTAMLGNDKTRLMSEAARGEGGRIWVPRNPGEHRPPRSIPEGERFYFLEEFFPAYGNTVARDEAARAIWRVTRQMGLGIGGSDRVYLDLTHLDRGFVSKRLGAILDIYRKFAGTDPLNAPMEIFPAAHYPMGGLWVDFERDASGGMRPGSPSNQATNIPGLYACGECDYAYHGANRLGANSLLSASFSGRVAGESAVSYLKGLVRDSAVPSERMLRAEVERQTAINQAFMESDGPENPYRLHRELGELMTSKVGVVRTNPDLEMALEELQRLRERLRSVHLGDSRTWANQTLAFTRQLRDMIELAMAVARSALERDECRGAHYKAAFKIPIPDGTFPGDPEYEDYRMRWKTNNDRWLKTSVAEWTPDGPRIRYEEVDLSVYPPTDPRDYR
ncbi:succinate dehydrogenase or fumarate reductase, flavoprotein subunit [Thiorhodococcus drewsii AZ1]|uniref:succinate dehydrogenase n=1 Tax=Thiorhodococcus drewsii AZ1 TaxID=765913 RepID=G2DWT2_9GAMM|nr:succinate dehydrogenase (quinone) flavoprotein subunit [Thiorhodococcus drewsii]EGV33286.1 succinate dehydrogenase or fumarate reductase, flavoprotein subunit [Thiorhodococcus drewsii AZ1]